MRNKTVGVYGRNDDDIESSGGIVCDDVQRTRVAVREYSMC